MAHFIHYVSRGKNTDPCFGQYKPTTRGFGVMDFHITRRLVGPAKRAKKGDTLWIFSQLMTPWAELAFPPALYAKIVVSGKTPIRIGEKLVPGFEYSADRGSCRFPMFDATDALRSLRTVTCQNDERQLIEDPEDRKDKQEVLRIGKHLQSMRELKDALSLFALEERLRGLHPEFVSYRIQDGTKKACEYAWQLVSSGKAVWLDRWSLPRGMVDRREHKDHAAMDEYIREVIEASEIVWGIQTPLYAADGSYSLEEVQFASGLKKLRPVSIDE